MSDDIVERLRDTFYPDQIEWEAADEIERLRGLLADHGYHGPDCKFGNCWCDESKQKNRPLWEIEEARRG